MDWVSFNPVQFFISKNTGTIFMKFIRIMLIFMLLLPASLMDVVTAETQETQTEADAGSIAFGTISANAGVSVSADETMASAMSHADSSSEIAASIANIATSGQRVESYSFSISDNTGSIAGSAGTAVGDLIYLFSQSTAIGKNVYAEGEAKVTASQSAFARVMTQTILLENGLYQISVQATANGVEDASGTVYTIAWAIYPPVQPVIVQHRSFSGFTFGHSDVERYLHFKNQLNSNDTNITQRAKYWLETLTWTDYALTQQQFEQKYINNSFYMNFTVQQYMRLQAKAK